MVTSDNGRASERRIMNASLCLLMLAAVGVLDVLPIAAVGATPTVSKKDVASIQSFLITPSDRQYIEAHDPEPFEVTAVPLSGGGTSEFLVHARGGFFCSPTGNCTFWVVVPDTHSFRILLKTSRVQKVSVLESASHGHADLETAAHDSAFESTHIIYHFDGHEYRRTKCAVWRFQDANDPGKILDKPRISPCS